MSILALLERVPNLMRCGERVFPATLPIPLQREHLARDRMLGFYAATPKVDGTRALLASDGVDVWELTRAMQESCLTSHHRLPVPAHASVFDAEVLVLADSRRLYYLFDCLLFRGRVATNCCVSVRIALARRFCTDLASEHAVKLPNLLPRFLYRAAVAEFARGNVLLTPKPFLPGALIPSIANTLSSDVPTDGWVFYQLGAHYSPGNSSEACLKYKPPRELTLDFRVVPVERAPVHAKRVDVEWLRTWALPALPGSSQWTSVPWETYTSSTQGNYYLILDLGPLDIPTLFRKSTRKVQHVLLARAHVPVRMRGYDIVECRFERDRWEVVRPRPDKTMSNRFFTVFDTLRLIAEPIQQQELYSALRAYDVSPDLKCF